MKRRIKKILILAANPKDSGRLRLDQEVREIDEGLRRSQHRDQYELKQKQAVRIQDLRRALLDEKPQIVHFCGHGTITKDTLQHRGRGVFKTEENFNSGIYLEDDSGNSRLLDQDALAELFGILAQNIECVVLNACYSESQAEAIGKYIPYVIGMKEAIGDKAAIEFTIGFYDGIGAGISTEKAFKLGCNAIQLKGIPENLTPIIKTNPDLVNSFNGVRRNRNGSRGEGFPILYSGF